MSDTQKEVNTNDAAAHGVSVQRLVMRPSGFKGSMKNDKFLKKNAVYGVKYFCTKCGKQALGTDFKNGRHHHWKWCELFEA